MLHDSSRVARSPGAQDGSIMTAWCHTMLWCHVMSLPGSPRGSSLLFVVFSQHKEESWLKNRYSCCCECACAAVTSKACAFTCWDIPFWGAAQWAATSLTNIGHIGLSPMVQYTYLNHLLLSYSVIYISWRLAGVSSPVCSSPLSRYFDVRIRLFSFRKNWSWISCTMYSLVHRDITIGIQERCNAQ